MLGKRRRLIAAFRQLREKWWYQRIHSLAAEREWEEPEQAEARERGNARHKARYDAQTEAIIAGREAPIAPICTNDLYRPVRLPLTPDP